MDGFVHVNMENTNTILRIQISSVKTGIIVNLQPEYVHVKQISTAEPPDDLFCYVHNFMQWYFVIIQMKDTIKEGDFDRTNVILKTMIPYFFSHSNLSKYLTECINFILKTEIVFPPSLALNVRAAAFVNSRGDKEKTRLLTCTKKTK